MSDRDDLGPGLEIPDLELEPAVSKRAAAPTPRAAAPAPSPPSSGGATSGRELDLGDDSFGSGDDDFELIKTGAHVELAAGTPGQVGQAGPTVSAKRAAWPTGRTRTADQLPIDAMEVTLVADYGVAPVSAILTPLYAYRVYTRRTALQRAVAEHHAGLVQEEAERDQALAGLANELRGALEASDAFRRLLEPIREVERLAGDRSAAFSEADAGFREQMGKFDQELGQLEQAATQVKTVVAQKGSVAERTDNELRRQVARSKRVQIEIRGVIDVARQALGPAGGDIPAPQAAKLAELQARATSLEPDLTQAKAAHAAASAELDQAQTELGRLEGQSRELQRQKGAAAGTLEKQLSLRAAGVTDAEKQRRDALADVARAVLASRGGVPVADATLEALVQHDARVEARAVRLETHVRALDSQDHPRVRQGVILSLCALGAVVLAIVLKAVL